jgi:hypothetical protein
MINWKKRASWILMDNIPLNKFDKFISGVKYHYDLGLDGHFKGVEEW